VNTFNLVVNKNKIDVVEASSLSTKQEKRGEKSVQIALDTNMYKKNWGFLEAACNRLFINERKPKKEKEV
jgi:hypothetical protein